MFNFPKLAPYTREETQLSEFSGLDKRINAKQMFMLSPINYMFFSFVLFVILNE